MDLSHGGVCLGRVAFHGRAHDKDKDALSHRAAAGELQEGSGACRTDHARGPLHSPLARGGRRALVRSGASGHGEGRGARGGRDNGGHARPIRGATRRPGERRRRCTGGHEAASGGRRQGGSPSSSPATSARAAEKSENRAGAPRLSVGLWTSSSPYAAPRATSARPCA